MSRIHPFDPDSIARRALPPAGPEERRDRLRLPGPGRPARPGRRAAAGRPPTAATGPARWRPKPPHFPAKAKRIIFLFMQGATSQMDTWEYKPQLQKDDGKVGPGGGTLTGSKFKFAQHGQTGTWVSELYPHTSPSTSTSSASSAACTPTPRPTPRPSSSSTPARPWPRSPGRRWARGCSTAWGPRTRTSPATSRSTRRPTSAAPSTTAAPSSPPTSRGPGSTTPATCPTSRPRPTAALQRKQLDLVQAMNRDLAASPAAPGPARRRDPVVRAGLQDAGQGARAAGHLARSRSRSSTSTA